MSETTTSLQNHFLIALETDVHSFFYRSVVYVCEHNENGSMGLIINQASELQLCDVFTSMEIIVNNDFLATAPVLAGGPVQEDVGFVLHKNQGSWESSLRTSNDLSVTTSKDILYALAKQQGPEDSILALGYSGWEAGQLEKEIFNHFWLSCPAMKEIIFDVPLHQRWDAALASIGIEANQLIMETGHA